MKSYKEFREAKSDITPETPPKDQIVFNSDLVEEIASLLHDQWMDLTKGLIKKGEISQETQDRWNTCCMMPYAQLSERMKEIDRVFARRIVSHLEIKGYTTKG